MSDVTPDQAEAAEAQRSSASLHAVPTITCLSVKLESSLKHLVFLHEPLRSLGYGATVSRDSGHGSRSVLDHFRTMLGGEKEEPQSLVLMPPSTASQVILAPLARFRKNLVREKTSCKNP